MALGGDNNTTPHSNEIKNTQKFIDNVANSKSGSKILSEDMKKYEEEFKNFDKLKAKFNG